MERESFKTLKIGQREFLDTYKGKGACFIIISGYDIGKVFFINKPTMIIGREEGVDIYINDPHISRRHAQVVTNDQQITLIDLKSTNGTYVNDRSIGEHKLSDGDRIKIGDVIMKFIMKDDIDTAFHEELYNLASQDGLTNIYNRMYLLKALDNLKSKKPFSLIMFDIDDFKKINDIYGHSAGDFVLREIAKIVKGLIRQDDVLARFGGEEFILLIMLNKDSAYKIAERIRKTIEDYEFVFGNEKIKCTISAGVFCIENFGMSTFQWIEAVDKLLYEAKRQGKNRVCC
ncbi:MAG: diguanylate cyclase [Candidatus Omnitrophica bacterium]|nr:diguanylate cyclase [Candidatus Omnitrophota bacterium]MCM8823804.1 diguanylate cyclase [Candidatus Omnitrophota bacterium]MCM8826907.1 diguanylate cyclase [Candidatus Omnitrophota bacterium]